MVKSNRYGAFLCRCIATASPFSPDQASSVNSSNNWSDFIHLKIFPILLAINTFHHSLISVMIDLFLRRFLRRKFISAFCVWRNLWYHFLELLFDFDFLLHICSILRILSGNEWVTVPITKDASQVWKLMFDLIILLPDYRKYKSIRGSKYLDIKEIILEIKIVT